MLDLLRQPMPWYIAGPLIGLMVPLLLFIGNKTFGISSNFRHICAMCVPTKIPYFNYEWKKTGKWQLLLLLGVLIGSFIAEFLFSSKAPIELSDATLNYLSSISVNQGTSLIPHDIFNWKAIGSLRGFIMLVIGGFLIGFGTRYANGCTSGHTISGISNGQLGSIIASIGFFIGGLISIHFIYPILF